MHLLIAGRLVKRLQGVQENARRLAHGLAAGTVRQEPDEIGTLGQQLEDAAFLMRGRERELRESEGALPRSVRPRAHPLRGDRRRRRIRRFNQAVCNLLRMHAGPCTGPAWPGISWRPTSRRRSRRATMDRWRNGAGDRPPRNAIICWKMARPCTLRFARA